MPVCATIVGDVADRGVASSSPLPLRHSFRQKVGSGQNASISGSVVVN
jgi:hypothetical protein